MFLKNAHDGYQKIISEKLNSEKEKHYCWNILAFFLAF